MYAKLKLHENPWNLSVQTFHTNSNLSPLYHWNKLYLTHGEREQKEEHYSVGDCRYQSDQNF